MAKGNGQIYGALFELGDDELVRHLLPLGNRAHLVLANGSVQVKKDPHTNKALETSAEARKRDENKDARKKLRAHLAAQGLTLAGEEA